MDLTADPGTKTSQSTDKVIRFRSLARAFSLWLLAFINRMCCGNLMPRNFKDEKMEFSGKDQLLFTLLTDIHKALNIKDSVDADFVQRMICDGDGWALAHAYPNMFLGEDTPPNVKYVMDVLDLWQLLELGYADLTEAERAQLDFKASDVVFPGFDGNNESELLSIARVLTEDLGKWAHFRGRIKNSHMPTTGLYERMLEELANQREPYSYELTLDQLQAVVRSRIHPSNR